MSATSKKIFACLPKTERGKPCLIGGDPKNGEKIIYCNEHAVVIRDLKDPSIATLYTEHQQPPTVARIAPSGFYVASGDASGTVRVWDTVNADHICKLEQRVLAGPIFDMAWDVESKRIIACGQGREKYGHAFFAEGGNSCGEIVGHQKPINSCDFKPTRPYRAATGSEDFHVQWYEGPPFKYKAKFEDHTRFVNCVRFSPDGNYLLTVGSDKLGFLYDGKEGTKKGELKGHTGGIYACSWSADGKQVLTASGDKTCKLWDVETQQAVVTFEFGNDVDYQQLGCLWQKDYLISVSLNGQINYLDKANPKKPSKIVYGHSNFAKSIAVNKQTNKIYTASYDAVVCEWDVNSGEMKQIPGKGHTNDIPSLAIQGSKLLSCSMDDTARVTPAGDSFDEGSSTKLDSPAQQIAGGKGDLAIVVTIKSLYVLRGSHVASSQSVSYGPKSVALNNDNTEVAVGGDDNKIHIYSLSGDKLAETKVIEDQRGAVHAVQYSPDGQFLAAGDSLREVKVYNAKDKSVHITGWCFHSAKVTSLSWSPNSRHIATSSLDSNIFVWFLEDQKKRIQIKEAHKLGVNQVIWIDDNTLSSVGQDACVKTWNVTF